MHPTAAAAQSIEHRRLSTQHDPSPTPRDAILEEILRERRSRTVLLRNVAESSQREASARQLDDEQMVRTVFDIINIQVRANAIYRVGKCGSKQRFLLVELPTRAHAVEVLRNGRLLKDSACQHIFVGLSMTPQERTDWFLKRQQLKATAAPPSTPPSEAPVQPTQQPAVAEAQPPAPSPKKKRKPKNPRKRNMDSLALQPSGPSAQQPGPSAQQPGPSTQQPGPPSINSAEISSLQRFHDALSPLRSQQPGPPSVFDAQLSRLQSFLDSLPPH